MGAEASGEGPTSGFMSELCRRVYCRDMDPDDAAGGGPPMELGAGNMEAEPDDRKGAARPMVELPLAIPALPVSCNAIGADEPVGKAPAGRTAPNGVSSSI